MVKLRTFQRLNISLICVFPVHRWNLQKIPIPTKTDTETVKNWLYRIVPRCSYDTDTDNNPDCHWVCVNFSVSVSVSVSVSALVSGTTNATLLH